MFEDIIEKPETDEEAIRLLREARREIKKLRYEKNLYKKDAADSYQDAARFARTIKKIQNSPDKAKDIIDGLLDLEEDMINYGILNDDDPSVDVTDIDTGDP